MCGHSYAVALLRALIDSLGPNPAGGADGKVSSGRDASRLSVQESRRQVQARITLLGCENHEFCFKNEELCIKNEELCIKNEETCIEN